MPALVPVTFVWPYIATRCALQGSWDSWKTQFPMRLAKNGLFSASLTLPPGRYIYNFVVNGRQGGCIQQLPTETDPVHGRCNVIEVTLRADGATQQHRLATYPSMFHTPVQSDSESTSPVRLKSHGKPAASTRVTINSTPQSIATFHGGPAARVLACTEIALRYCKGDLPVSRLLPCPFFPSKLLDCCITTLPVAVFYVQRRLSECAARRLRSCRRAAILGA